MYDTNTLVVNLFAGPGSGKSTTAAKVFHDIKIKGVNAELATEYAKELVWEERKDTFRDQIYMFGKQYHRIFRLLGKVDVVITDSPFLLSPIYDYEQRETLKKLVIDEHKRLHTLNIFIRRKKEYNPKGRNQTLEESIVLDKQIENFLVDNEIKYYTYNGTSIGATYISKKILKYLKSNKKRTTNDREI